MARRLYVRFTLRSELTVLVLFLTTEVLDPFVESRKIFYGHCDRKQFYEVQTALIWQIWQHIYMLIYLCICLLGYMDITYTKENIY